VHPNGCGTDTSGTPDGGGGVGPGGGNYCQEIRQPNGAPLTPGQVANMRACICHTANNGTYIPFIHDCQYHAGNCIGGNGGVVPPGTGRLGTSF
jgi:hypothetical protein